ncbi:MAG: Telomerase protein component 1 [Pycnora praestabilis]|nr:MAG: Telomerase protein component 1 [Pycnora praestabilis]
MASLLRQIVAGPRSRHPETGLDLCYVTDKSIASPPVIATSGPSSTYPQLAYRNPLDSLTNFLDSKHSEHWAIWEFRAEGTGYPDDLVYNRIWHYPWPDHHPPPFALIPNIMASMRNWLNGADGRVVVVHCKAGKGRSGTVSCAYLISEEGWKPEKALKRFTERRMRTGFGAGVSIPSQLRWIEYVDRWTRHGKLYIERQVEIMEVHVWGLRDGVKVAIEGYVDEGKTIKTFHTFNRNERILVENPDDKLPHPPSAARASDSNSDVPPSDSSSSGSYPAGGSAVIFRPITRVVLPTNDINIDFERRNRATYGWTMVTSVAHVWFNAFFEGQGAENAGRAAESGVFEIDWDKMDGIRGSSKKGTRALDRLAVVWRIVDGEGIGSTVVVCEPGEGEHVKQMHAANWKSAHREGSLGLGGKGLGLRTESPVSANVSKASSINSATSLSSPSSASRVADEPDPHAGLRSHAPGSSAEDSAPRPLIQVDRVSDDVDVASTIQRMASPERIEGEVGGMTDVSTRNLPDGKPEYEMNDAKEHSFGHLKKTKDTKSSS